MKTFRGAANWWRVIALVFLGGFWFVNAGTAHAATLFVTPSTGQFGVGQAFNVVVRVNSQGKAVNASEGLLSFNPAQLQVQSISSTGSIFNLNVQEPEFSNTAGTVRWTGVILNPGYNGTSGNLITVRFKGMVQGATSVKYSSGAVLANDGAGTNVLSGMSGGTYTIGPVTQPPTLPSTGTPDSSAPVVTSPTHPDNAEWYSNNDPLFRWELPDGVDGVSFSIDTNPNSNPGNVSDGAVSEVAFTDVPEGTSYFHIKFHKGAVWGPIAHFPIQVDTVVPDAFALVRDDPEDTKNPRPILTFNTTDSGSGLQKYVIRIGDSEAFEVPEELGTSRYAIPVQLPGTRTILVEAVDRAGNSIGASLDITIEPIGAVVIVEYPPSAKRGEEFVVTGTADPLVSVRLEALRTGGVFNGLAINTVPTKIVVVKSNAAGNWTAILSLPDSGRYRLQAIAVDDRGASSYPSEPVFIDIGFNFIQRAISFLGGLFEGTGWLVWLLRILVFLLLMMIISALAHDGEWQFWAFSADVWDEERREVSKLREIAQDIDEEIALLTRVGRHRSLYPGEKYLKSKLLEYRKTISAFLRDSGGRLANRK